MSGGRILQILSKKFLQISKKKQKTLKQRHVVVDDDDDDDDDDDGGGDDDDDSWKNKDRLASCLKDPLMPW